MLEALMSLHRFANPARFQRLSRRLMPWLVGACLLLFPIGLLLAFLAPADYQQGLSVRIMYVHVPSAWMGLQIYALIAVASAVALIWRHPLADLFAKSASPIGAAFTAMALATGSLWGKPMWGTWWVWDARLTSMLILLFLYLGHMLLFSAFDDRVRGQRAAAVLALVGAINLPIIKFSVNWWNTLHQPASILRWGAPTIDPSMLWPLFVMAIAFNAYFAVTLLLGMRAELLEARLRALQYGRAA